MHRHLWGLELPADPSRTQFPPDQGGMKAGYTVGIQPNQRCVWAVAQGEQGFKPL